MAARDRGRFADARARLNQSPLGAAARRHAFRSTAR
jgi:argininosuccinate lyase